MQLGAFIEIGISLAFLYTMLSLMCSTINEIIANRLELRSSGLKNAIREMIDNDDLYCKFYENGLIRSELRMSAGPKNVDDQTLLPQTKSSTNVSGQKIVPPQTHSSYLASNTFAAALIDSLDPATPIKSVDEVKALVETLAETSNVRSVLLAAIGTAQNDVQKLRTNVAGWFDQSMDRLSGQYKRDIKWWTMVIGIAIVVILNADTLSVTRELWRDSALRSQVGQMATAMTSNTNGIAAAACDADPYRCKSRTLIDT